MTVVAAAAPLDATAHVLLACWLTKRRIRGHAVAFVDASGTGSAAKIDPAGQRKASRSIQKGNLASLELLDQAGSRTMHVQWSIVGMPSSPPPIPSHHVNRPFPSAFTGCELDIGSVSGGGGAKVARGRSCSYSMALPVPWSRAPGLRRMVGWGDQDERPTEN